MSSFHHSYYKAPFKSFTSCSWSSPSCVCRHSLQASYWALYHWRPSQHSVSHLSDRCLPPKQWVITVLHLSGCTHLIWSAAFLLLFLVMAWHPQSAYQAPFFWAWHTDALSLSCSVCLCLSFIAWPAFVFSISFSLPRFLFSLTDPNTPIKGTSRLCGRKSKKMFCHLGNKERSNLSLSILASWPNVYPPHGVVFFTFPFQHTWMPVFIRLTVTGYC